MLVIRNQRLVDDRRAGGAADDGGGGGGGGEGFGLRVSQGLGEETEQHSQRCHFSSSPHCLW